MEILSNTLVTENLFVFSMLCQGNVSRPNIIHYFIASMNHYEIYLLTSDKLIGLCTTEYMNH